MPGQSDETLAGAVEHPHGYEPSWSRRRILFVSLSGLALVALLLATRAVLLPFVLALIIAYVLTPLVAFCERRMRMPRSLAIVFVYAVTLGGIYASVAAMAPRIYEETVRLTRDAPALIRQGAARWGPRVEAWVNAYLDRGGPVREAEPVAHEPAISVVEQSDGSLAVELRAGVDVVQENERRWRIAPREEAPPEGFSVSALVNEGLDRFVTYVKRNAFGVLKLGQTIVANVSRAVFLTFMTLMVAGYIIHTREEILAFFRSLAPPNARPSFDRLLFRMDRGLAGVVRGQLLICLVNGVLSAVGFWIFDLNYWPILAIVAGVMSIIPIFGSILSTVPAVAIGLTQDVWVAVWVLVWIVGIHQVEANLLNPKIIGVAAKLHPVLVVFALLVGEHFFGLWGALLAVPALSLAQSFFNHFRFEWLPDAGPDSLRAEQLLRQRQRGPA